MKYGFTLLFLLILATQLFGQPPRRYVETVFPSSTATNGVVYGEAPFLNGFGNNEQSTTVRDLVMDIYEPTGDTHDQRAAIIFAHAGGFITGNRNHDDMVALCDSFAQKGYVTATIDYRKGLFLLDDVPLHGTRAVYRGIQDGRTAIRYLRTNAAALGVDPDQIYMWGSSAGSFIALHAIYLDDSEKPPEAGVQTYTDGFFTRQTPDLGSIDAGSNPGVSGTPNGIVGMWGAVAATDLVDAEDDEPVFLTHGTDDGTVPFTSGFPFSFPSFPIVFGSSPIADQLAINGTTDFETYFVPGGDHEFYGATNGSWSNGVGPNTRWDTLLNRVTPFLWRQHRPSADFVFSVDGPQVTFTDASTDAEDWFWDFGDGSTSTDENPVHTYTAVGDYPVELFVRNALQSWDTLEMTVTINNILPLVWARPLDAMKVGKAHRLTWSVAEQRETDYFAVEVRLNNGEWQEIGRVAAAGNYQFNLDYNFEVVNPASGEQVYRLRQTDLDGRFTYSNLAVVNGNNELVAYPNPVRDLLTVTGLGEDAELSIIDAYGRVIRRVTGNEKVTLRTDDLVAGLYLIRLTDGRSVRFRNL